MFYNMIMFKANITKFEDKRLTDNEMLRTVTLKEMWLNLYVVIQNSDYQSQNLEDVKQYVTLRTGQYNATESTSAMTYNDLIDCDSEVTSFHSIHKTNNIWLNFLEKNHAYCIDPSLEYDFKGSETTKDLEVMVLDI